MVKMGNVWDRTAEFLAENIPVVLPIALLAFFVPASIQANFATLSQGASLSLVLLLRLIQLAFAILSLWGTLAIVALALGMGGERRVGAIARDRLPLAVLVWVAVFALALVAALPVALVLHLNGFDFASDAAGQGAAIAGALRGGVVFYVVPMLLVLCWAGARIAVTAPAIVREKRGLSALVRSWRLTRRLALPIFGVLFLFSILSWVAQLAARSVFGSVLALIAGTNPDGLTLAGVLTGIVVAAVQAGFSLLIPAFSAKLYQALVAREGLREELTLA